ncbi:hypothetical protein MKX03_030146 [Papaver bracteatum]|nr:hypothetical protein MKX03_030146 [Papaver bracteatum]
MGSISSLEEDGMDQSERYGSYSISADVSESESSSSFTYNHNHYNDEGASSSFASSPLSTHPPVVTKISGFPALMLPVIGGKDVVAWEEKSDKREPNLSEVDMMKERFAKLLLGEDMSGGGKGVCTALAISNAITNLSATVFGELWKLEPLAQQKKSMWCREMQWLLCVSDSIVELIPSIQEFPGGGTFEVMVTRPRSDLYVNLPALKKLDAMLLSMLDGFSETEFCYEQGIYLADANSGAVSRSPSIVGRPSVRQEEKWWLPCPMVPPEGLSEVSRKRLQQCRECTNQILKAAMAINSGVLAEMEIPSAYLESLPKNGKCCLGEILYRCITAQRFSPESLLDSLDLSSEHQTVDLANRIEAAVHVWRLKEKKKRAHHVSAGRSTWGGKVKGLVSDMGKSQLLAQRAQTLLQTLRLRYPGLPQTLLDMNKIQYNKDVGQSILESYSRVMESLAFNIMARIDDLLYVDDATRQSLAADSKSVFGRGGLSGIPIQKPISPSPFSIQTTPYASPFATPSFLSSTPVTGSPKKTYPSLGKQDHLGLQDAKLEKLNPNSGDRVWSGNLSVRKGSGDLPERD